MKSLKSHLSLTVALFAILFTVQIFVIVLRLIDSYEDKLKEPPEGDRYQDCYDVVTGKPGDAYVRLYQEVKEELFGLGIPFD